MLDCLSDGPCEIFLLNSQNKMIWQVLLDTDVWKIKYENKKWRSQEKLKIYPVI